MHEHERADVRELPCPALADRAQARSQAGSDRALKKGVRGEAKMKFPAESRQKKK